MPKLCAFKELQQGHFLRAVVTCLMKARTVPDVWRSDRRPEMVNAVQDEFRAILTAKHVKGAALTPRHQGLNERGHQEVLTNHIILMKQVCDAYPQEWCSLVEALEYLNDTEPQGDFVRDVDRRLAPFLVPVGHVPDRCWPCPSMSLAQVGPVPGPGWPCPRSRLAMSKV